MNEVFIYFLKNFVIVFLDDMLIYSKIEKEHEHHLIMVLKVLMEHQLYAQMSKHTFYQRKIHYLGHIVSEEGIAVNPKKFEENKGWTRPKNIIELRYVWD